MLPQSPERVLSPETREAGPVAVLEDRGELFPTRATPDPMRSTTASTRSSAINATGEDRRSAERNRDARRQKPEHR
jgi:hypothetical protein